jgi:hypothetical protein
VQSLSLKLTEGYLTKSFKKMRLNLAAQVFDQSVATATRTYVNLNKNEPVLC